MDDRQAAAEDVGLCPERLERIGALLAEHTRRGLIPGAVAVVYRRGVLAYRRSVGVLDPASGEPMRDDAVFRIYSMTKPLVSVAALALYERGLLRLTDPVARYLPELGGLLVAPPAGSAREGAGALAPAGRDPTVLDLLRHTSGLVGGYEGTRLVTARYADAGIVPFDHTAAAREQTTQDLVKRLATVPLAHEPGTVWEYGRSGDVLGRVLEVASGTALDALVDASVLGPLDMRDTGFFVPRSEVARLAQPSEPFTPATRLVALTEPPAFLSGGSGCYSTARDYLRLCRMLLAGGVLDGRRILGRKTVELMTSDHLGGLAGSGPDYIPGPGYAFGLGCAVRLPTGPWVTPGSAGDYWWLGRAGTSFFVDPAEDLIGLVMMQQYWQARPYQSLFKTLVNQAVVD